MLRIAVCDDNPVHLDHAVSVIGRELASYAPEILRFPDAESLLTQIRSRTFAPDIAVLDIEMDGKDGIELARDLNRSLPDCQIIFLTAYLSYAPEVYETEHIWFVLKSRMEEHIGPALRKALSVSESAGTRQLGITLKGRGKAQFLPLSELLYLSRVGRRAQIVTLSGTYYSSSRPADLIPGLLEPCFVRCHQGYWVNLNKISFLDHDCFVLADGSRIPISRTYREDARRRFFQRVRQQPG